jgi:NAD-dependent dihydropyrimidine dehydrogenase PreA subunit/nitrate reductase gamma subunit
MDFGSFLEGPLLWIVFLILIVGVLARLVIFFVEIIKNSSGNEFRLGYNLAILGRFFAPFHMAIPKRPLYAALRYIFHICMIVVPIWFSGHIMLWSFSRFEWEWNALPDIWVDWMTIILLGLAAYFLIRRIVFKDIRLSSSISDYVLIILTALPFITGYSLTHGFLEGVPFLGDNMWSIHVLSGEAMMLMVVFLFCRTMLNASRCTGCAACEINCPTGTLESSDEGKLRTFIYSHYQCICCGSCVSVCPEDASELRHEISLRRFFQIATKHEIRSVELKECERCGAFFAPEPQIDKVSQTITADYLRFCPACRKTNLKDIYYKLAPLPVRAKIMEQPEASGKQAEGDSQK